MCGIVAYKGKGNAAEMGFRCLKRLEYRGYDSYGGCVKTDKLYIKKEPGKISEEKKISLPKSNIGIFHTRWATHGSVNKKNAHPHLSCDGKIALVHNGIIENHAELRKQLGSHTFKSQTDTEVIVHLIEELRKKMSMGKAFASALGRLEGNYAVAVVAEGEDAIYAAKKGSPLVIGVGDREIFLASDIPAFLEHTNKVIFLEDGDIVTIKEKICITNNGKEKKAVVEEANIGRQGASLGKFKHYMLKEIFEQKETIGQAIIQDKKKMQKIGRKIREAETIFFTACGTAHHASLLASYHLSQTTGKPAMAILASELKHFLPAINERSLVLAVTQSGETADVVSSVNEAKARGAGAIAVTNVMGSSITRAAGITLLTNAGPEIAVASTKAFTAQAALLYSLIGCAASKKDWEAGILEAQENVRSLLNQEFCEKVKAVCKKIKGKNLFVIGKGKNYPLALEAALKIKEISYIHAEGFAGGELKHGTLALVEKGTPCIVFANKDDREIESNAMEIKARGGEIIWVSPEENREFKINLLVPKARHQELLFAVPAQLIPYYLGIALGRDIDKPRNLAKSVTTK